MKNNKVLIILTIIVVILILGIGGFTYAYMTTDILKSDKQLFSKYIGEIGKEIKNLESTNLTNYFDKLEKTPYKNEGKLSVNVNNPDLETMIDIDKINNMNITFSGKTDKRNKIAEQNIKINYSDEVSFPIDYKHTEDMYGIKSDLIVPQYIAVKNENLQELLKKFGILDDSFNEELAISEKVNKNTKEQLKPEIEKCKQIILNNLKDENFSRVDENTFALILNGKEVSKIYKEILEELRNSDMFTEDQIDSALEQLKELEENGEINTDEMLRITVNKSGKVVIMVEDSVIIKLEKTNTGLVMKIMYEDEEEIAEIACGKVENANNVEYTITCKALLYGELESEFNISMAYSDLTAETVRENYIVEMFLKQDNESIGYKYTFDTAKTFVNSVNIDSLASTNTVILNDQSEEYIGQLLQAIILKWAKVNNEQMEAVGLQQIGNPLIYATPLVNALMIAN